MPPLLGLQQQGMQQQQQQHTKQLQVSHLQNLGSVRLAAAADGIRLDNLCAIDCLLQLCLSQPCP
jgi:hypothetical protein